MATDVRSINNREEKKRRKRRENCREGNRNNELRNANEIILASFMYFLPGFPTQQQSFTVSTRTKNRVHSGERNELDWFAEATTPISAGTMVSFDRNN